MISFLSEAWGFRPTAARLAQMSGAMALLLVSFAVLISVVQPASDLMVAGVGIAFLVSGLAVISWLRGLFFSQDVEMRLASMATNTGEIDR